MTYKADVIHVMIASPGDVAKERQIVRDVIHEWNAIYSENRGLILMPIGWETHSSPEMGDRPQGIINKRILKGCDLLIAVFWTRLGSPTGVAESGTVEEIREHLAAGKPAMIYFSSAPVRMDSVDTDQYSALTKFRDECRQKGIIEEFESSSQFREKVTRNLAQTVLREFSNLSDGAIEFGTALPDVQISDSAKELLVEASSDKSGIIMKLVTLGGSHVQTNGREFVIHGDARSEAKWRGAISELEVVGYVEDRSGKGEVYFMTDEGFQAADIFSTE